MRPMVPFGCMRAVPMAFPWSFHASTWLQDASRPSHQFHRHSLLVDKHRFQIALPQAQRGSTRTTSTRLGSTCFAMILRLIDLRELRSPTVCAACLKCNFFLADRQPHGSVHHDGVPENDAGLCRWVRFTDGRSSVKTQRRIYGVVAGRRIRSGLWHSWCQVAGRSEAPPVVGWSFLRSVWSLLCRVTWGRIGREQERRLLGAHNHRVLCAAIHGHLWSYELTGGSPSGCRLSVRSSCYSRDSRPFFRSSQPMPLRSRRQPSLGLTQADEGLAVSPFKEPIDPTICCGEDATGWHIACSNITTMDRTGRATESVDCNRWIEVRQVGDGMGGADALRGEAEATVLHVTDVEALRAPFIFQPVVIGNEPFIQEEIKADRSASEDNRGRAKAQMASLKFKGKLVSERGQPGPTILERAPQRDGLVAIGSRGLDALDRLMLGSVSTQVTLHAPCSVLIVKEEPRPLSRICLLRTGPRHQRRPCGFF